MLATFARAQPRPGRALELTRSRRMLTQTGAAAVQLATSPTTTRMKKSPLVVKRGKKKGMGPINCLPGQVAPPLTTMEI